ncbi:MAG TPA: alpha/beta hydrolase [Thermoanaerobaculia bacterium]|jgi:pimeloyl-ACP methyl ester carboxylesterase|nr:alpha/beta hydrolase [Thermoanaerobaculia bacterium]
MKRLAVVATFVLALTAGAAPRMAYNPELTNFEYPFPVAFHELTTQRQTLRMAYLDVKPETANGRVIVLMHGKNFSAAQWEPTIRALTKSGFRVIAPDQIGFGKSSKPAAYQFSFHTLADNTGSLLDAIGVQRVSVVGHSMGGMLATRFALLFPDRVERLVLVNPIGLEDYRLGVPYRNVDALYEQELKATPESIRDYQQKSYYGGEWKPEYDKLIEAQAGQTLHPEYPRVAWNSALTTDMIITQPVLHEFPHVKTQTLLIIGLRDRTAVGSAWARPDVAKRMGDYTQLGKKAAAAIPRAKLVEIPGVGHIPQIEAFSKYIDALMAGLK